jgi:hypothetical protein
MFTSENYQSVHSFCSSVSLYGHRFIDAVFENPVTGLIYTVAILILLGSFAYLLVGAFVLYKTIQFVAKTLKPDELPSIPKPGIAQACFTS